MIASPSARLPFTLKPWSAALAALLLAAFGLRIFGLDWDEGRYLHPDERFIVQYVLQGRIHLEWPLPWRDLLDPATSGLNPRSANPDTGEFDEFAYGALPLFVTGATAEAMSWVSSVNWHATERVYLVGRTISAVLDTFTVLLVYLIGARVFSRRVGLLAAAIAAMAPMSIQLAHFFTTDSWLTFFVALTLLCAIRAAESGRLRWFAAMGVGFGLAMASKGSVFTLAGLLVVATAYDVWRRQREGESGVDALAAAPERLALAGASALGAFALFEPYALLKPSVYLASLETQSRIVRGIFDVPFTRQYIGTTAVVYQVEQLVRWGFGPVAGVLALIGLPLLIVRFWRERTGGVTLVLAWFAGYSLVIALPETKFLRYLAPLAPVLAISAGVAVDAVWSRVDARFGRRVAAGIGTVLLVGAALWTIAFTSVYAHEHTRLAASRWIYDNIPSGSTLSYEYWDDELPKDLAPGLTPWDRQYEKVRFELYRDYPSKGDLNVFASALVGQEATRAAGEAMQSGDYRLAVDELSALASDALELPVEIRISLASELERAAGELTSSHMLGHAARVAATNLRDGDELVEDALIQLGGAIEEIAAEEVSNVLYENLEQIDYYIISSNRVLTAIPRSPWRYPVQARFYELLESGELGFTLVREFTSFPSLGPWEIPTDSADESFINYDHPHVWIYQKVELVPRETYDRLMADAANRQVSPTRHAPNEPLMLDEPVGELTSVADGRWSEPLTRNSVAALVVWVVLLAALQLAGWPLASFVFGRFADAGWGFARLIALLVTGYVVWLGASLQLISFRAVWAAVALVLFAAVWWVAWWRLRRPGGWPSVRPGQRQVALTGDAVFWAVFALFLLFRYLNPDSWHPIWGGEKPMEFAHINAILRSAHFPPFDPWYADGYINYYYYGLYLVALLFKLTGIPSEIAFNLAQPTIIALLAAGGFSIAATLGRHMTRRRGAAIPAGLLGVLFLLVIGNLDGLLRLIGSTSGQTGDPFVYWVWSGSRAISTAITEFPYFTALYADLHAHVVALPITVLAIALGYAVAREPRLLALVLSAPGRSSRRLTTTIARFGLLALALGSLSATNAWDVPTYLALGGAAIFMATAQVRPVAVRLGATAALAITLGLASYALFLPFFRHYVALFGSLELVREPTNFWQFSNHLGGLIAVVSVGLVALLVGLRPTAVWLRQPFALLLLLVTLITLRTLVGERVEQLNLALTTAFVVTVAVVLGAAAWYSASGWFRGGEQVNWLRIAIGAAIVAIGVALAGERHVLVLLLAVATAAGVGWAVGSWAAHRYVALMVAAAALVGAGVELVFIADNLVGGPNERMNTIFKFYNQLWVLLALAAATLVAKMATDSGLTVPTGIFGRWSRSHGLGFMHSARVTTGDAQSPERGMARPVDATLVTPPVAWSRAGLIVAAVVVAASLIYPVTATGPRLEQRFADQLGSRTLNGLDWMNYGTLQNPAGDTISFRGDRAAIEWLNANVEGSPVIAEASIGPYRGNGSRISNATGLPTILGWDNHQTQQRYLEGIWQRNSDVRTLYTADDPAVKLSILRRYNVEYVIVGDVERKTWTGGNELYASPEGIAAFEQMVGTTLQVAFAQDGTIIYRVEFAES